MRKFEVLSVSESLLSYKNEVSNEEYFGVLPGLLHGWQFEFSKNGETNYSSVTWYFGSPEEFAAHEWAFEMERWNGWEPTGRVVFRGYGREYWWSEEREMCVEAAPVSWIQEAIAEKMQGGLSVSSEPYEYEEYEELERKWA